MGKRGPPPKPTALKKLEGTYREDRAPDNEAMPDSVLPDCPDWLKGEAKKEWLRIGGLLEDLGLVSQLDRVALAAYCQCWARYKEAEEDIEKNGSTFTTEKGYVGQRPQVAIRNKMLDSMKKYLSEFGLSPASRTRVNASKKKSGKAADFLYKNKSA